MNEKLLLGIAIGGQILLYVGIYFLSRPLPPKPARCLACNGDDSQSPCAYPSGNRKGCLRDLRLKRKEVQPIDWRTPPKSKIKKEWDLL